MLVPYLHLHSSNLFLPWPKSLQIKVAHSPIHKGTSPRVPVGEQKPMPLLRFVILKQSTDQRVGVSFVAEDEDELEYGAQRPRSHGARSSDAEPGPELDAAPHDRPGH